MYHNITYMVLYIRPVMKLHTYTHTPTHHSLGYLHIFALPENFGDFVKVVRIYNQIFGCTILTSLDDFIWGITKRHIDRQNVMVQQGKTPSSASGTPTLHPYPFRRPTANYIFSSIQFNKLYCGLIYIAQCTYITGCRGLYRLDTIYLLISVYPVIISSYKKGCTK